MSGQKNTGYTYLESGNSRKTSLVLPGTSICVHILFECIGHGRTLLPGRTVYGTNASSRKVKQAIFRLRVIVLYIDTASGSAPDTDQMDFSENRLGITCEFYLLFELTFDHGYVMSIITVIFAGTKNKIALGRQTDWMTKPRSHEMKRQKKTVKLRRVESQNSEVTASDCLNKFN